METKIITDRKELAKIETFFLELTDPFRYIQDEHIRKLIEEKSLTLINTIRYLLNENEYLKKHKTT
ncbi:Uncharacterised protein [[Flavobacterium] thermophilum]|nr:Uncharacterised protein [[Flavobacterium] thermophilum]